MSVTLPVELIRRWASLTHVGDAAPRQTVTVQRGFLKRQYDDDGHWTAVWTPDDPEPLELPGVRSVSIDWNYDSNGIKTATIEAANVFADEKHGPRGTFHRMQRGWYSPLRAYHAPQRPRPINQFGNRIVANEWDDVLTKAAMITVNQGYGDILATTFTGLLDTVNGSSKPTSLSLAARDMGLLLTDVHCAGWNHDPRLVSPVTFVDQGYMDKLWNSKDPADLQLAVHYRRVAMIIDDVTDIARHACRWAGFPKASLNIAKAGTSIKDTIAFSPGEYLIDLVKKVQDATGMVFYIGLPTDAHPLGRPTMAMSNASHNVPVPVVELRDDQLLTDIDWEHTNEPLAGIIRVRGKEVPRSEGGKPLRRGAVPAALMSIYRPPWHSDGNRRDARMIRHVIHSEPLYHTQNQVEVAARLIALQEALAANTGTFDIPGHPGLELDDVLGIVDRGGGLNTRVATASIQSQFDQSDGRAEWKQTLGVALLDTPDVVEVTDDLGALERQIHRQRRASTIGTWSSRPWEGIGVA